MADEVKPVRADVANGAQRAADLWLETRVSVGVNSSQSCR
jgi:hypothetical protein